MWPLAQYSIGFYVVVLELFTKPEIRVESREGNSDNSHPFSVLYWSLGSCWTGSPRASLSPTPHMSVGLLCQIVAATEVAGKQKSFHIFNNKTQREMNDICPLCTVGACQLACLFPCCYFKARKRNKQRRQLKTRSREWLSPRG